MTKDAFHNTLGSPGRPERQASNKRIAAKGLLAAGGILWMVLAASAWAGETSPAHSNALKLLLSNDRYDLGPYIEYYEDKTKTLKIEDITSDGFKGPWHHAPQHTLTLGITNSSYWIRFTIEGQPDLLTFQSLEDEWLLDIGWWNITLAQLYIPTAPDGDPSRTWMPPKEAGVPRTYDSVQTLRRNLVFRLPADLAKPHTFYMRVESETVLFLPLTVSTAESFMIRARARMLFLGIFYGLVLAMVLYNLILYFSLQDRNYLWYVLYVSFLAFYFLGINGLVHEYILPGVTGGTLVRLNLSFLGLALVGTGLFTRSFLMTRRNAPTADKFVLVYTALAGILVLFAPFVGSSAVTYYALFAQVATFIPIVAGLICLRGGFRPARYFLLAWTLFMASAIIYAMTWKGVLAFTAWNLHSFQIGSALEAVLLSLALGDRVRILRWEHEATRESERRYMELSITDHLTSLLNARYFREHIGPELQRAESMERPLSLLMIDVDNFKHYNDSYGHPEGDKVLSTLGQVILSSVRDNDFPCRYGGEEFAIILPGSPGNIAVDISGRIRKSFEAKVFMPRPDLAVHVTVSTGVAEHILGQEAAILLERADKALYQAKEQGKNQIVLASR